MIVFIVYNDEFDEREIISVLDGVGYTYVDDGWYDFVLNRFVLNRDEIIDCAIAVDLKRKRFLHSMTPFQKATNIITYSTENQLKIDLVAASLSVEQAR